MSAYANKKFNNDLKKGQIYEAKATEYFDYNKVFFPKGNFSDYDFILDDKIKVEVKSDCMASKTGNLAIEYKCNGNPSGIYATKADWYVYFINHSDHDEVYKIPTEKLIEVCKGYGKKASGGDGGKSRMYLLNKALINDYITTEKKHEPINVVFEKVYSIPFGKYKGKSVEEVWKTDRGKSYLKWLCEVEWFRKFGDLKDEVERVINL